MSLMAKQTGSNFPPVEEGTFQAVCYSVVDLGTQFSEYFKSSAHKVLITWEIPELRIDIERDDKPVNLPRAISKQYTLSLNDKSNLCKDLAAWRGKSFTAEELEGFDVLTIAGANCLLGIIHTQKDNKTYANVATVTKLMKNMPKLKPESPIVTYSMDTDGLEFSDLIPEWVQNIIKKSEEFRGVKKDAIQGEENPDWVGEDPEEPKDDLPF